MQTGECYHDEPGVRDTRLACWATVHRFNETKPGQEQLRRDILSGLLAEFGENSETLPHFQCSYGKQYLSDEMYSSITTRCSWTMHLSPLEMTF